jgi:hypothetical protein
VPWWAITYAVFYFVLSVIGDLFTFKEYRNKVYWCCEVAAHFGIGVLLVGYWVSAIPDSVGWLGVTFFLFAVLWEINLVRSAAEHDTVYLPLDFSDQCTSNCISRG